MEALEGLAGIAVVADDILVYGEGDTMVEANLNRDLNFKLVEALSREKFEIKQGQNEAKTGEVKYIEHKITRNGVMADNEKIEGIRQL